MSLRPEAISNLTERLKSGQTVGGLGVRDLLDCELDGERCRIMAEHLGDLLMGESGERAALADQIVDGLIERYLSTPKGEELIREEIAEIMHAMEVEA